MAPVHGTHCKVKEKKWNKVCFLSLSLSSPKKRYFFHTRHPAQCHNQSLSTTSYTMLSQPKSTRYAACRIVWEHGNVFVCVNMSSWERATVFRPCLRTCEPAWCCVQELDAPGAEHASLRTCAIAVCRNKRVETPGSRWVEEEKYLYWWEPHTHLSPPPPYMRLRDRSGR